MSTQRRAGSDHGAGRAFRGSAVIGVAAAIVGVALAVVLPSSSPGMPEGFTNPILAFEFARAPEDILTLFGPDDTPARRETVAAMDLGNKIDFLFLALYSLFLLMFSLAAARLHDSKWLYVGAACAVVVALGDALENLQLLALTAALDDGAFEPALSRLRVFTWIKWGGLAAIFAVLAPFLVTGRAGAGASRGAGLIARIAGAACVITAGLGALAAALGRWEEVYALAVAVVFVLLLAFSLARRDTRASSAYAARRGSHDSV